MCAMNEIAGTAHKYAARYALISHGDTMTPRALADGCTLGWMSTTEIVFMGTD